MRIKKLLTVTSVRIKKLLTVTLVMALTEGLAGVAVANPGQGHGPSEQGSESQRATENAPEDDLPFKALEFVVVQNSSQNDYNREEDKPYIEWEKDGTEITFTFVNPTPYPFVFDYRIDGEEGEEHDWSDILIVEGELEGKKIGPWYNPVTVINDTYEVTVTAEEEVWVGMRVGAKQNWYLDWIIFELQWKQVLFEYSLIN